MVISGYVAHRYTRTQCKTDFLALYLCQRWTSSENTSTFLGRRDPCDSSLSYERFLELRKCCQYVEYQLATGRGRVDILR